MNDNDVSVEEAYSVDGAVTVTNYKGEFFYPEDDLQENLEKVVVFPEANTDYKVPNGTVWQYGPGHEYNPDLLNNDVGCGITGYKIEDYDDREELASELVHKIETDNIDIGRGNHFIDVGKGNPRLGEHAYIFLHSDMKADVGNHYPSSMRKAQDREKAVSGRRRNVVEDLTNSLGLARDYLGDWPHKTVRREKDSIIYRKGAIDIRDNGTMGILARNPYCGIDIYSSIGDEEKIFSMQHGTGVKREKRVNWDQISSVKGDDITAILPDEKPQNLFDEYKSREGFNQFVGVRGVLPLTTVRPDIVIPGT